MRMWSDWARPFYCCRSVCCLRYLWTESSNLTGASIRVDLSLIRSHFLRSLYDRPIIFLPLVAVLAIATVAALVTTCTGRSHLGRSLVRFVTAAGLLAAAVAAPCKLVRVRSARFLVSLLSDVVLDGSIGCDVAGDADSVLARDVCIAAAFTALHCRRVRARLFFPLRAVNCSRVWCGAVGVSQHGGFRSSVLRSHCRS
jgi:hypothetical protein